MKPGILKSSIAVLGFATAGLAPVSAFATDDVTLILDWTPGGLAGAWYLGIEDGCFPDQDIDLTVERGYGGSDTVTKIAAGVAPFGAADLSSVMLARISADARVRAILPIYSTSPVSVAVLADSGIETIADLEGKTIAAAPGDSGIRILPLAFEQAGVDFGTVNVETVESATLSGLLIQGQVDAITTFATSAILINEAAQQVGRRIETINFAAELGVYSNSVLTTDEIIETNPDLVERFTTATQCAFEAAREDPRAAVEAMDAAIGGLDVDVHVGIVEIALPLVFEDPKFESHGFGWDPEGVAATLAVSLAAQELSSDADPSEFVYSR